MDISMEVWAYVSNVVSTNSGSISNLGALVDWSNIMALGVSAGTSLVCCSPPFDTDCQPNFSMTFNRNEWNHLACSLSGTDRVTRGYINGDQAGSYSIPSAITA